MNRLKKYWPFIVLIISGVIIAATLFRSAGIETDRDTYQRLTKKYNAKFNASVESSRRRGDKIHSLEAIVKRSDDKVDSLTGQILQIEKRFRRTRTKKSIFLRESDSDSVLRLISRYQYVNLTAQDFQSAPAVPRVLLAEVHADLEEKDYLVDKTEMVETALSESQYNSDRKSGIIAELKNEITEIENRVTLATDQNQLSEDEIAALEKQIKKLKRAIFWHKVGIVTAIAFGVLITI